MRLLITAACALSAAVAVPAFAQPGADHAGEDHSSGPGTAPPPYHDGHDHRPVWKEDPRPEGAMDPGSREAWLADCRYRVAQRGFAGGADHCAAWLSANAMRYDGYGYGETVMIPVSKPGECTETVVYEEPAPVIRRAIPRRAPGRDKRVPLR